MRIAFLALHFAEYASRLALALAERHEVLLVLGAANARVELSDELLESLRGTMIVEMRELPRLRSPRVLRVASDINRIIHDFRPDVLHIQEYHQAFTGLPILSMRKTTPVIITVHDPLPHSGTDDRQAWRWKVVQWFRRKCCRMIVHGSRNRTDLEASNRSTSGRVDIVPHGILGKDSNDAIDFACEPGTFLFFGRIEEYKGLRYLLDAGDILHERGHDFRVLVAGRGNDLEQHRERIETSPWVELHERFIPVDDLPALFGRALVVVLPYTDATQSGVSAMAFAYSRPVIATDVGDVPEVVVDGESGLIVPPRDALALADAMEHVMQDPVQRERLAKGAARTARDKLSWHAIADQTQLVYERALQSRRERN